MLKWCSMAATRFAYAVVPGVVQAEPYLAYAVVRLPGVVQAEPIIVTERVRATRTAPVLCTGANDQRPLFPALTASAAHDLKCHF